MAVHFGAVGDEAPMDVLWGPNFYGAHTVLEAAYRNKLRRVVYASSIHAVGMHMVESANTTPITDFSVVYSVSNSDRAPVDNAKAQHLGCRPKDKAEQFAAGIYAYITGQNIRVDGGITRSV